jgi:hypothetical protein
LSLNKYNRDRVRTRATGPLLVFGPRLGWRRQLRKRRYEVKEPDVALGECPFGGHHAVGQAMLADEWVQRAITIVAARLPPEEPEPQPARKRARRQKDVT